VQNDIEHELLEFYDFCPDAAARFPTIGLGQNLSSVQVEP
jgi:hypothetical protein